MESAKFLIFIVKLVKSVGYSVLRFHRVWVILRVLVELHVIPMS